MNGHKYLTNYIGVHYSKRKCEGTHVIASNISPVRYIYVIQCHQLQDMKECCFKVDKK